jgi:hypothetical protein
MKKNEIRTPAELRAYLETHAPREAWNAPAIVVNGYTLRVYSSRDYAVGKNGERLTAIDYYADYITNGASRSGIDEIIAQVFPAPKGNI